MTTLAEKLRDDYYYDLAAEGSLDNHHPAMQILKAVVRKADSVIDLGCGEGTRLAQVVTKQHRVVGIDVNKTAIDRAKKKYPAYDFGVGNLETIDQPDNSFEVVFSAYVFEHLEHPEKVLQEMYRIVQPKGKVVIIAPNFGAPNRCSPNSKESRLIKLWRGFVDDLRHLFDRRRAHLYWTAVQPQHDTYTIDADTVVEPYLESLVRYARWLGFVVEERTSCWSEENFTFRQWPFKLLGSMGIYPFNKWGPHLCVVLRKKDD